MSARDTIARARYGQACDGGYEIVGTAAASAILEALTAAGYTIVPTGGVEAGKAAKIVREWADWIIGNSADMDEPEWPTSSAQSIRDKRDAVLAALASPHMPVPAGFVLVPEKPTWEMEVAGRDVLCDTLDDDASTHNAKDAYRAPLSSRPKGGA